MDEVELLKAWAAGAFCDNTLSEAKNSLANMRQKFGGKTQIY